MGLSDFRLAGFLLRKSSHSEPVDQFERTATGIKTLKSYKRYEKAINNTLIKFSNPSVEALVRSVLFSDRDSKDVLHVLFLNASFNNELLDYLNQNVYFPALYSGRATIKTDEVIACIQELKQSEQDLQNWADSTIKTTAGKYLTLMKKFGLMEGGIKKTLSSPNVTDRILVLFVYWLLAVETKANVLESHWLTYSFLDRELFVQLALQKKFMKYWNVAYSGDRLRLEPTLKYEELYDELAKS